ncbi:MAG: hypothetical protein KGL57_11695, partial [Burkholderiales bacterium]|nr:hypothetical protein [Burkholderiales bacterium]
MKQVWIVSAMLAGALVVSAALVVGHDRMQPGTHPVAQPASGLPWQIQTLPGGQTQVMGLRLGGQASTLADAQKIWGGNVEVAIIAAPGEGGALEAFVDPAQAGFISGKLVLTLQAPADAVAGMRQRALKSEFMESTTRKYTLAPADRQSAAAYAITAVAFIPQANLDATMVIDRFGQPAERR